MCGIYGVISKKSVSKSKLKKMESVLLHRGPDGVAIDKFEVALYQIYLGHLRLAILDLTQDGAQPFLSRCGNYALIYNGEVYNYLELKEELIKKGYVFSSKTDTEVVLYALIEWGPSALNKFNGMWAISFLDLRKKTLLLSRDRFGVKPLYYMQNEDEIYFSSEIKSILLGSERKVQVSEQVAFHFLSQSLLNCDTNTFYQDIYQVPPASYVELDLTRNIKINSEQFEFFWRYPDSLHESSIPIYDLQEELDALFTDAVRIRLRSDVPVGVTLSGGIDSSSIVAKMSSLLSQGRVGTFSAISNDRFSSEEKYIDVINNAFNCKSNKINLDQISSGILNDYEKVVWYCDQPVLSFSSVAFYHLMQAAKMNGFKVVLSGQGADELLCGYRKYVYFYLSNLISQKNYRQLASVLFSFVTNNTLIPEFSYTDAKKYIPAFSQKRDLVWGARFSECTSMSLGVNGKDIFSRQITDLSRTSVPALLHYEDRLSMASSIEVRLPFLDYRLAEFCLRLPTALKLNKGWSKWLFRESMKKEVPHDIIWRKDKKGFTNPQELWFKNQLREDIQSLFDSNMLSVEYGYINRDPLRKKLKRYLDGDRSVTFREIYNPFAFEIWLRKFNSYIYG